MGLAHKTTMPPQEEDDLGLLNKLMANSYGELKAISCRLMAKERPDHTLQATALLNEAYLRLSRSDRKMFANPQHFMATATTAMHHILVDHARSKLSKKRGERAQHEEVDHHIADHFRNPEEVLAVHEALEKLREHDYTTYKIVEMRYFTKLVRKEVMEVLGINKSDIERRWRSAKIFLSKILADRKRRS